MEGYGAREKSVKSWLREVPREEVAQKSWEGAAQERELRVEEALSDSS